MNLSSIFAMKRFNSWTVCQGNQLYEAQQGKNIHLQKSMASEKINNHPQNTIFPPDGLNLKISYTEDDMKKELSNKTRD